VKLVKQDHLNDVTFYRQFIKELVLQSLLEHPNITNFYGLGRVDATREIGYIIELSTIGSLYRCLSDPVWCPKSNEILLGIARDVSKAMEFVHSLSVLHRDLTSKNILLFPCCCAKIADFGTSCKMKEEGVINYGTRNYMPPEIATHEALLPNKFLDPALLIDSVDIYAYGIILVELFIDQDSHLLHSQDAEDVWSWSLFKIQRLCQESFSNRTHYLQKLREAIESKEEEEEEEEEEWEDVNGAILAARDEYSSHNHSRDLRDQPKEEEVNTEEDFPEELCKLIFMCVSENPKERPSFSNISQRLCMLRLKLQNV